MLPRLFIGSSQEAADRGLVSELEKDLITGLKKDTVDIVRWDREKWLKEHLSSVVEALIKPLVDFSYTVFILSADDTATIRDDPRWTPRDNVWFEFGLFLAHLDIS